MSLLSEATIEDADFDHFLIDVPARNVAEGIAGDILHRLSHKKYDGVPAYFLGEPDTFVLWKDDKCYIRLQFIAADRLTFGDVYEKLSRIKQWLDAASSRVNETITEILAEAPVK